MHLTHFLPFKVLETGIFLSYQKAKLRIKLAIRAVEKGEGANCPRGLIATNTSNSGDLIN